ncbi:MAG TPA: TonB-dependent receptor [Candidatus Baltobacteraceae bacterium]|nr:TonB-dependent receptor [Candidatus Baltobacteraceae bacterium]
MTLLAGGWRLSTAVLVAAVLLSGLFSFPASAQTATTGAITGTVTDPNGKPVADVQVTAASPSQTASATTNNSGFYSLVNLTPDTYTVSFQKQGFAAASVPGVTVFQLQTATLNHQLQTALRTIAQVRATGASNLVKSNQGSDVYNVSGQQLTAATNPVNTHETLYQYLAVTPGVTGTGFPSQPRVRGGQVTDLGYQFDGIPIQDRMTGFFTTNLANIGIGNIEVYTGGLPASGSTNGTGFFNSVVKTGTYPASTQISVQVTSPEANQYLTVEQSWATPDHKYSAYIGFDGVNSTNQYSYGEHTFPNVLMQGFNGPGPVRTRDWVGNFIYRPSQKDALQFLLTNSLGEFDFNYLLMRNAGEATAMAMHPCPGAINDPSTFTGGSGGTAPNGQACTQGLYYTSIPNGGGNIWHHYGGLGKIQWNHNINEHSFFNLRLAENFNQYIFDQPWTDPNVPAYENPGGNYNWWSFLTPFSNPSCVSAYVAAGQSNSQAAATCAYSLPPPGQATGCPSYPLQTGTPVTSPVFYNPTPPVIPGTTTHYPTTVADTGDLCTWLDGFAESFYGDRRSNMYFGNFDYTNQISANLTLRAGLSHEYDNNLERYYVTNFFQGGAAGTPADWPDNYLKSVYPTIENTLWADADVHVGKLLLTPGLAYATEHYGCPVSGCTTQHALNPTFNGTYTFDPKNVVRFSYGNTSSFIGAVYVYRENSRTYNPSKPGFSYDPQINHSADLMYEHAFNDGTTVRLGPFYNKTDNYFEEYTPIIVVNGVPTFGKSVLSNGQRHKTFGLELAVNHVDNRPTGISYWLAGTYNNYWATTTNLSGAFVNFPLPQNIINQGIYVRAFDNPLVQGTLLADLHSGRFHFDPMIVYSADYFFNTGLTSLPDGTPCVDANGLPFICQNEQIAGANWWTKLVAYEELGPSKNFILGLRVDNFLNNTNDVAPCVSDGTGCFPFNGPQSGVVDTPGSLIFQNYSQGARTFFFFAGVKL